MTDRNPARVFDWICPSCVKNPTLGYGEGPPFTPVKGTCENLKCGAKDVELRPMTRPEWTRPEAPPSPPTHEVPPAPAGGTTTETKPEA